MGRSLRRRLDESKLYFFWLLVWHGVSHSQLCCCFQLVNCNLGWSGRANPDKVARNVNVAKGSWRPFQVWHQATAGTKVYMTLEIYYSLIIVKLKAQFYLLHENNTWINYYSATFTCRPPRILFIFFGIGCCSEHERLNFLIFKTENCVWTV